MHSRPAGRSILTVLDAAEIYKYRKEEVLRFNVDPKLIGNAKEIAKKFDISPKTVRDIWNRRTWIPETRHLWRETDTPTLRTKKSNSELRARVSRITRMEDFADNLLEHTLRMESSTSNSNPLMSKYLKSSLQNVILLPYRLPAHEVPTDNMISAPVSTMMMMDSIAVLSQQSTSEPYQETEDVNRDDPFHDDWPYW